MAHRLTKHHRAKQPHTGHDDSKSKATKARNNYEKVKANSKPGSGKRFAALSKSLEAEGKSPEAAKAIAASIGRKKYGAKKMSAWASKGKK